MSLTAKTKTKEEAMAFFAAKRGKELPTGLLACYSKPMNHIVVKARLFALKAHKDQKYGEFPYSKHLEDVVNTLSTYYPEDTLSETVLAAAWLHDTIEDTEFTFKQIFEEFGRNIARIVFACTDEPGANRKERHARTYPKLMAAGREAIAVKLADRISNINHSLKHNHSMFEMYQKEYPDFKKALHLPGELKAMWATLDMLMEYHRIESPKEKKNG